MQTHKVGAIILAAGGSARFGEPKQFLAWQGENLIRRIVRVTTAAGCAPLVVVTGAAHERIAAELRATDAAMVPNPEWERGLGTSIRAGVNHLLHSSPTCEALILLTCDQPFVDAKIIAALRARWLEKSSPMVASRYANTLGIPALFERTCFPALLRLADESGARTLLLAPSADVAEIEFEAGAIDIDTPADYERARTRDAS